MLQYFISNSFSTKNVILWLMGVMCFLYPCLDAETPSGAYPSPPSGNTNNKYIICVWCGVACWLDCFCFGFRTCFS